LPLPFDLVVDTLVVEVAVDFALGALGAFAFVSVDDFGALAFGPLVLTVVVVVLRPDGACALAAGAWAVFGAWTFADAFPFERASGNAGVEASPATINTARAVVC
jgi:hypothetical protein